MTPQEETKPMKKSTKAAGKPKLNPLAAYDRETLKSIYNVLNEIGCILNESPEMSTHTKETLWNKIAKVQHRISAASSAPAAHW